MKCPSCHSSDVRRSRFRPEDGLWRSIFYTAFRCRGCGLRFDQLTRLPLLVGVSAAALALAFGVGFLAGGANGGRADFAPTATYSGMPVGDGPTDTSDGIAPPGGDLALAASAGAGDPRAQLRFGLLLLKGSGVEKNVAAGTQWIHKAAEQGYPEAQFVLGAMHHAGRDALQSFPLAFKWFEQAARQNHPDAQYSLGVMYRNGQGIPADKAKAYLWFNLAAAQGNERAREARDQLLSALTPEQVVAAQRAAQEWRPEAPK